MLWVQNLKMAWLAFVRPQRAMHAFAWLSLPQSIALIFICYAIGSGLLNLSLYQYSLYLVEQSDLYHASNMQGLTPELELLSFATATDLCITIILITCVFVLPLYLLLHLAAKRSLTWLPHQAISNALALAMMSGALAIVLLFLIMGGYLLITQTMQRLSPTLLMMAILLVLYFSLILPILLMSAACKIKRRYIIVPWMSYFFVMNMASEVIENVLLQAYPLF